MSTIPVHWYTSEDGERHCVHCDDFWVPAGMEYLFSSHYYEEHPDAFEAEFGDETEE